MFTILNQSEFSIVDPHAQFWYCLQFLANQNSASLTRALSFYFVYNFEFEPIRIEHRWPARSVFDVVYNFKPIRMQHRWPARSVFILFTILSQLELSIVDPRELSFDFVYNSKPIRIQLLGKSHFEFFVEKFVKLKGILHCIAWM